MMQLVDVVLVCCCHYVHIVQEDEKEYLIELAKKLPISVQMISRSGY